MDFIMGLPLSFRGMNSYWLIVDRLTKSTHFLAIRNNWSLDKLTKLYMSTIVRLHGVPSSVVSDHDSRFQEKFWKELQKGLGTRLNFSTTFHPSKKWSNRTDH